jgi:plastocyanin
VRRLVIAWGLVLIAALGASTAWAGTTAVGVQNGISETSFSLTRSVVDPGSSFIQYTNTGEDPHDFNMKRRGDTRIFTTGEIEPGLAGVLTPRLRRDSRYTLWCSLPGHRDQGMEAVLRVRDVRPN